MSTGNWISSMSSSKVTATYTTTSPLLQLPKMMTLLRTWIVTILVLLMTESARASPRSIKIGSLFEPEHESQELALKYAVESVNERRDILPLTTLLYDVETVPAQDSFAASKTACTQINSGIAALFGPISSVPAAHVQSICDHMGIPHIETRWEYRENPDYFSINLHPHHDALSEAYVDFVLDQGWQKFTVLYDNDEGLIRLQGVFKAAAMHNLKLTVRRLEPVYSMNHGEDYRPLLKELKMKGETRIMLDCDHTKVQTLLHQALTIRMVTPAYAYFLTSMDIGIIDLEDYKYDGCNITAYQLVSPTNDRVSAVTTDWIYQRVKFGKSPLDNDRGIKTETALMYDAIFLFARSLDEYLKAQDLTPMELSCASGQAWQDGEGLLNYMKLSEFDGLTGHVKFDNAGKRTDFKLDLVELTNEGLREIGHWNQKDGLNITMDYSVYKDETAAVLKNKTLVVTTILEDPYMMLVDDPEGVLEGNARFEGYCVDLLHEIASQLGFSYKIKLVDDKQYGSPTGPNGEWTGMVKELMDTRADLAVASLTISYVREQVIDFTKPFLNLGISILFKKPEKKNPSLWSFLAPLSFEIWAYVVAAYLGVSFMLFVLARFSPYEWSNPHPCNDDSEILENQFNFINSLWFTIGSLMQQGCEIAPKAVSTRVVSMIWWFFTLIIISSYTANLAAFLTVERMTSPIENADDLSKQTEIKYGTLYGGSTMMFFKNSHINTYERMWRYMSNMKPSVFVNNTKDGIRQVEEGNYAFLLESTMNEYVTERNCQLSQIGGLLDNKGYGIATPRGSPYRDHLSNAILKLQEDQVMQVLYNKWWKEKGVSGKCDVTEKKDANALEIANVGGVFVVLVAGLSISLIVAVLEFCWNARKNADEDRQSLCSEMAEELRFAVRCFGSSKKPVKKKSSSKNLARQTPTSLDGPNGSLTPLTAAYRPSGSASSGVGGSSGGNPYRQQFGIPDQYT